MTLSYKEFRERCVRIINAGNAPLIRCYNCKAFINHEHRFRFVDSLYENWYLLYYSHGCPNCKAPLYLESFNALKGKHIGM